MKVLNIIDTDFNPSNGGVVSFLNNYLLSFSDDADITYDIMGFSKNASDIKIERLASNSTLYMLPKFNQKDIKASQTAFSSVLDDNSYDIVHLHSSNFGFVFLPIAKKKHIRKIIVHSHNTQLSETKWKCLRNRIFCMYNERFLTHRAACSNEAGGAMFGKKKFSVIPNAIQCSKFSYDEIARTAIRNQYHISSDDFVIGIVGRLCRQKNHIFLFDVVKELVSTNAHIKLIVVGDGPDRTVLEKWIAQNNMKDNIILAGHKTNVNDYLAAFDVFTLPSVFEGFGIVVSEAIATGLPCVCSTHVAYPDGIGFVKKLPLRHSEWIELLKQTDHFQRYEFALSDTIYDLKRGSLFLKQWYMGL